ncbi:MAG TPA: DUF748 domain-containing protein [Burkholderiales bacterium]|jgi:uncharacterized protein involved in outer membrane biogenesis
MNKLVARLRARRILLGVSALLLAAYAAAGFFLVPYIARSQIEASVAETLQRRIAIGEIRFNPFTLAATLIDLKLTEADGAPLVSFRSLYVNAEISSLWRRGVVFKEIDLDAPDIEVIVAPDGSLNLARLAPPAAPAQDKPKTDEAPLRVHIGRFSVEDGRIGVQDRSLAQPFNVAFTPIRFSLRDFRTDVGHSNEYSFTTSSRIGARLEWSGAFTVQPLGSRGTFSVADLRLAALDDYLEDKLPAEMVSGSLQFRGSYKFELNPLSLEVALPSIGVRDLVLAERGVAASAPIALPEIDVHDVAFSLSRRDVGVRRVDVRGARIEVVREPDGGINLARFAGGSPAPAESPKSSEAPWTVHADAISLETATVVIEDRTLSPAARLQLTPAVMINGFTTARDSRMKVDVRIGIDGKGHLGVKGDVGLEPLGAALAIDLQKFPLPSLQPWVTQATAIKLHSGSLGLKGNLNFTPAASKFSGGLSIDDVRASDEVVREDLLKWRTLAITGIQFQQRPDRLRIERIVAREPYARVIIAKDGGVNIANALKPRAGAEASPAPAAQEKPAAEKKPLLIAIRTVELVDGSANFADYSVQPDFAIGIVGLGGQITGLSSAPESRAKVALNGRVDEYSPVDVSGEVNVLSAALYTKLALNFRNIELTAFNPYAGKFAGYSIAKGKLSTQTQYHVEQGKLDAKHHISVDNLEFGDRTDSKDAAPIPIKLGVALLKDRRGMIEVDLPVSGTLDDPEFHLGSIIWKSMLSVLANVIRAPFAALGSLFGSGEDLAFVEFQPGSAVLGDAETRKLETLAKGLVERPVLRLSVPLTVATAADSDATARQALAALVPPAESAAGVDEDAKRKRIEALEGAYRMQLKTEPAYLADAKSAEDPNLDARIGWLQAALLEDLKPGPAALEALGKQRAGAVRDALLANKDVNPERVFIVAKPAEAASPAGLVRMEMKLE